MNHHRHGPSGRLCSVPGCTASARNDHSHLCEAHRQRQRRHGHVRQRGIIDKDTTGQLAVALHQLHALLGDRARQSVADARSGRPGSKWERIAGQEVAKVVEVTDALDCAALVAGLFLLRDEEPGQFVSEDGFRFQLARLFRAQTDLAFGSYWDQEAGKVKTVYRDLAPRTTAALARWVVDAYARLVGHVVAWDRQERTRQAEATATTNALVTIADTQVPAAVTQEGKVYFSPKAICESLGIDWSSQRAKIMTDAVLSSTVVEITMVAQDGKQRLMTMLPKEMAPGWLFTIKKVSPEVQDKLNRFRLECFVALDTWFNKGLRNDDEVMEAYRVPQSYKEALLALVAAEEEKERLVLENQKLLPKADAWTRLCDADGAITSSVLASTIGVRSAQALHTFLHERGIIRPMRTRAGKNAGWLPTAAYSEKGYHRTTTEEHGGIVRHHTRWTPAGAAFIAELMKAKEA
ncbi:phage antirepressor N-terminal domain-containing protein [Magnetospirillum fulvum]|uniref:Phage antirepressor protein YoqD, KilAC domain n=1 Tax=Magnetospirillum fulvum TaxID=1082 RepID=A0A1H6J0M8_MAGFU|nr:phage antirepressor N-terminal domain-containing protein [Magnetospirillum fulvum]SEH52357.1 Phage antirepressor protein YoqD, KilAC domain [Magnetospirillum fulvum]